MIVTQQEIDLVLNPKIRRRMMRLPITWGVKGEREPCPVREECSYQLQPRAFAKGQATITILEVRQEKLTAITLADARKEGYAGIQGALTAWTRTHHTPDLDENVWVVTFAKDKEGDIAAFIGQGQAVFLARHGDYTTRQDRAIRGEPEVLMPLEEDLKRARARAVEQRMSPQREALNRAKDEMETLRQSMESMKARTRARLIERELAKLALELPSEAMLECA